MTPSTRLSDVELGRYVDELSECYDVDNNGVFNRTEMIDILKGTLYGQPCPAKRGNQGNSSVDNSTLLSDSSLQQIESFFGNKSFSLTRLYASDGNKCNAATWHSAVDTKSQVLTVAKTASGKIIGGYSSLAWRSVSSYSSLTYINDPTAFLFSLTLNKAFNVQSGYTDKAISVRPGQLYTLNDWGYESLHLRSSIDSGYSGQCQGYSNVNYTPAYKFGVAQTEFSGVSSAWFYISSLETFQVTFN